MKCYVWDRTSPGSRTAWGWTGWEAAPRPGPWRSWWAAMNTNQQQTLAVRDIENWERTTRMVRVWKNSMYKD